MHDINKMIAPPITFCDATNRLQFILSNDIKDQIRLMDHQEMSLLSDSELSTKVKNAFDLQNNMELLNDCKTKSANDAASIIIQALWWKLKID
jgi:uncharacterized protein DUF6794